MRHFLRVGGRVVLVGIGFLIITVGVYKFHAQTKREDYLLSPIPKKDHKVSLQIQKTVLGVSSGKQNHVSKYLPQNVSHKYDTQLETKALSYLVYEKTKDEILYGNNISKQLPIASITKIMTALIVLEEIKKGKMTFDTRIVIPESAQVGEASMGLSIKESVRIEDLLYGALLPSGNDAAEALAYGKIGRAHV